MPEYVVPQLWHNHTLDDLGVMVCSVFLQGMKNPLDGVTQLSPHQKPSHMSGPSSGDLKKSTVTGMFQYFLKVSRAV
jgi:hypothetical protein